MDSATPALRRFAGGVLALGGFGFFLAGALHPQPSATGQSFDEAMATMLAGPTWYAAHWAAVMTTLAVLWGVWLLLDAGWTRDAPVAHAGARLLLIGGVFMAVQFAVELAAAPESPAYAFGTATPMGQLVEAMQAVGWPAFMFGFVLLIGGLPDSAPAVVRLAGVLGAAAVALGGFLTEGVHFVPGGLLFIGGNLLAVWLVWAGIALARHSRAVRVTARPEPAIG